MAAKKKKKAGKKKPKPQVATVESHADEDLEAEADEDEAEASASSEDEDDAEPSARAKPALSPRGRAKRQMSGPEADPNVPKPNSQMSQSGGLIFVGVVISLIGLAIALQFILG